MKLARCWLVLGLALAACSPGQPPSEGGAPPPALDPQTGYPAPGAAVDEGYPAPEDLIVAVESGPPPAPPAEAPETQAGTASISGVLYSRANRSVIPATPLYIIAASGEDGNQPPELLLPNTAPDGALQAISDNQGQFSIANVPPGKYYLFVWSTYDWRVAEKGETDEGQWLIELTPDQRQPLGVVYVSWP